METSFSPIAIVKMVSIVYIVYSYFVDPGGQLFRPGLRSITHGRVIPEVRFSTNSYLVPRKKYRGLADHLTQCCKPSLCPPPWVSAPHRSAAPVPATAHARAPRSWTPGGRTPTPSHPSHPAQPFSSGWV